MQCNIPDMSVDMNVFINHTTRLDSPVAVLRCETEAGWHLLAHAVLTSQELQRMYTGV